MKINHNNFIKLAFQLAKINLGKTSLNPPVGCVVVKNNSVISSGYTSLKGRPHAEFNALNKKKKFKFLGFIRNYGTVRSLWINTSMYKINY